MEAHPTQLGLECSDWSVQYRNEKQDFLKACFGVSNLREAYNKFGGLNQGGLWDGVKRAIRKHHLKIPLRSHQHINNHGDDIEVGGKTIEVKNYAPTSYIHKDNIPDVDLLVIGFKSNIHEAGMAKLKSQGTKTIFTKKQVVPELYHRVYGDEDTIPFGPDARRFFLRIGEKILIALGFLRAEAVYETAASTPELKADDALDALQDLLDEPYDHVSGPEPPDFNEPGDDSLPEELFDDPPGRVFLAEPSRSLAEIKRGRTIAT